MIPPVAWLPSCLVAVSGNSATGQPGNHFKYLLLDHLHEMRDAGDHAPRFRRVDARRHPVHLPQAEGSERLAHVARTADSAADLLDLDHLSALGRAHDSVPSSTPRSELY